MKTYNNIHLKKYFLFLNKKLKQYLKLHKKIKYSLRIYNKLLICKINSNSIVIKKNEFFLMLHYYFP